MQNYILNPYEYTPERGFLIKERVPGDANAEAAAKAAQQATTGVIPQEHAARKAKTTASAAKKDASKSLLDSTLSKRPGTVVGTDATSTSASAPSNAGATRQGVSVEEALNSLFPPEDDGVDHEGNPMKLVASQDHAEKMDVIHLQESLEKACGSVGARAQGVCPLREGIYTDALDEVIRQVTVKHPERGLVLAELRDEVKETNTTYGLLFDAASQFGVRKEIERDLKRTMQRELENLTLDVSVLDHRVSETKAKHEGLERMFQERRTAEDKKHAEEVAFLKKGNAQLQTEIKRWGVAP